LLKKREKVAELYKSELAEIKNIVLPPYDTDNIRRSWFVYVIQLKSKFSKTTRDKIVEILKKKGIACGIYFPSIHLQPFYQKIFGFQKRAFPVTEFISERSLALPFYSNLSNKDIKYIANSLKRALLEIN
jgi:perosamine synthetase